MEHNGDLYSCDHYVEPDYLLGNITEKPLAEMVQSEEQRAFGMAKLSTLPDYCRGCEVRFACNGGCPKNRFTMTPDGEGGLNYLCAGYKTILHSYRRTNAIDVGPAQQGTRPRSGQRDDVNRLLVIAGYPR